MSRVLTSPLALTSDGNLLLGMTHTDGSLQPEALLERALASGSRVFIGIEVTPGEATYVRTFLHDGCCEAVATVAGQRARDQRRR